MKKGFYYFKTSTSIRCYYLTGEKKGNKWIDIADDCNQTGKMTPISDSQWMSLIWTCLPNKNIIDQCTFHETNPTVFNLNL